MSVHNCPCCSCACESIEQVRALQEKPADPPPYAPDWIVQAIVDRGPRDRYRWHVIGINANCEPGAYGREFYWSVPDLSWRYDLSSAKLMTASEALRHRITDPAQ